MSDGGVEEGYCRICGRENWCAEGSGAVVAAAAMVDVRTGGPVEARGEGVFRVAV